MKVELTFTEPLLGTLSGNKEIAEEFIISKHPDGVSEEESESVDESIEKSSTIFARTDGNPMIWDYQVKGFFKSACLAMIKSKTMTKEELKNFELTKYMYKRTIDLLIFASPRKIVLALPSSDPLTFCERPLRAETMRGERIALARSEQAPAGTKVIVEIISLNKKLEPFIERWLDYGQLSGFGQWRNSGMGRFEWKKLKSE